MPISHKLEVNLEQHNSYSKHALLKVAPKASSTHVNVQRGFIFPPLWHVQQQSTAHQNSSGTPPLSIGMTALNRKIMVLFN